MKPFVSVSKTLPAAQTVMSLGIFFAENPSLSALERWPPQIRDFILLQLERMGCAVGFLPRMEMPGRRAGSVAMDGVLKGDKKRKDARIHMWERYLETLRRYMEASINAYFTVAAAEIVIDQAIEELDSRILVLESREKTPNTQSSLDQARVTRKNLGAFKETTLETHKKALKSEPRPTENRLIAIQRNVTDFMRKQTYLRESFQTVFRHAKSAWGRMRPTSSLQSPFAVAAAPEIFETPVSLPRYAEYFPEPPAEADLEE